MDPYYNNNNAMSGQPGIGFVLPPPLPNSGVGVPSYPPPNSSPSAPAYPPQAAPMYPQNQPTMGVPYSGSSGHSNPTPLVDRPYDPYAQQQAPYGQQPQMHNAYPQGPQTGPYYPNQCPPGAPYCNNNSYPGGQASGKTGGSLFDNAGKMVAGGLAGAGLGKLASKIPGMGGHGKGHGYGGHGHSSGGGSGFPGGAGGALGSAAALGVGGALAAKMLKPKKMKKNKLLKYGLPLAGIGVGGYALKKGMHGFHRSSSSSSSSSDSD